MRQASPYNSRKRFATCLARCAAPAFKADPIDPIEVRPRFIVVRWVSSERIQMRMIPRPRKLSARPHRVPEPRFDILQPSFKVFAAPDVANPHRSMKAYLPEISP